MKVLVTGSAGFIGSFVARKLLGRGDAVTGIDSLNDYYDPRLKLARLAESGVGCEIRYGEPVRSALYPAYEFVRLDVRDSEALGRLFEGGKFDAVCHLAAQAGVRYSTEDPASYVENNVNGFLNILEACKAHPVGHLVYASSSSVYGANTKIPFAEDDRTDSPASLYAATKKSDELMAEAYSRLYGIPATGLRFFTVYGPWGRPDMAAMIFTKAMLAGEPLKVYGGGQTTRDFTYIDDIVEGVARVIDRAPEGTPPHTVYNIGHGSPVRLADFITALERELGVEAVREMLPPQPGDVRDTWADCSKLERDFGYRPRTVLGDGVREFINWYLKYYPK